MMRDHDFTGTNCIIEHTTRLDVNKYGWMLLFKNNIIYTSICFRTMGTENFKEQPFLRRNWNLFKEQVICRSCSIDHNYLCNRCLSPLLLWVRIQLRRGVPHTALCHKVCQWLAAGRWFSPGSPVSATNNTDRYDIADIVLKW